MGKFDKMIPKDDAFRILDEVLVNRVLPRESRSLRGAFGCYLGKAQHSRLELPPFDKSAMDGFAVRGDERLGEYRVIETIAAGQMGTLPLEPGTAVKIMTGAPVPAGGGRVIKVEDTEPFGDRIRILNHEERTNIAPRGQDVAIGDEILTAGTRLGAIEIANLAACGVSEVDVFRPARMAVLSTGDEIVDSAEELAPGKIMNSNGPLLENLARECGIDVVAQKRVADSQPATVAAIRESLAKADLVVLSGGVSVGDFDFVLDAMNELGLDIHFSRVAILPGKPTVFASNADTLVFGLPGNPVSVFTMFSLFVLRAVSSLSGAKAGLREFSLPMGSDFQRRKIARLQHVPCRIGPEGTLHPVEYHGSAHLRALMMADGFFLVPVGTATVREGEMVSFLPLPRGFK